jgi:hypothetical protein
MDFTFSMIFFLITSIYPAVKSNGVIELPCTVIGLSDKDDYEEKSEIIESIETIEEQD